MKDQYPVNVHFPTAAWQDIVVSEGDKRILRELAKRIAALAQRPIEEKKRKLWTAHNDLEPTRPLIFCDPENGWLEIITDDQNRCEGAFARQWEDLLLKELFWGESLKDDRVITGIFNVPYVATETDWGMHEEIVGGEDRHAYTWIPPLKKDYSNRGDLKFPEIIVDYEKSDRLLEIARDVFDGILEVRRNNVWWWTLGMTWTLVNLRGLEQIMYDMYDYPNELHELMSILRDGHLAKLDFLEKNGLLFLNNDGTYIGSGGFGWTKQLPAADFDGKVRLCDMWGFGESQETNVVSAEMFEEFIFPYQKPVLERFGLLAYGCCEVMNRRWHIVSRLKNLRRVSVSPWADVDIMAENLGGDYVYSYKPNPTYLAVDEIDADFIRKALRDVMRRTRDCRVEIIMKDNNTIHNNPRNVTEWVRIAKEEAENL